jgi:hypothetical protein
VRRASPRPSGPNEEHDRHGHLGRLVAASVALAVILAAALLSVPRAPARLHESAGRGTGGATIGSHTGGVSTPTTATAPEVRRAPASMAHPVTAPSGFRSTLGRLYSSMYGAAMATPSPPPEVRAMTPSQFQHRVDSLSALAVNDIYTATRSQGGFAQAPVAIARFVPVERRLVAHLLAPSSHARGAHDTGPGGVTPQSLTSIPDSMPTSGSAGDVAGDISDFNPSCPTGWQTSIDPYADNAIFGLQIVIDALNGAYNALSQFDAVFPGVVVIVVLLAVAQGVQNWGAFLKNQYNDCMANNFLGAAQTLDNSTYQTYELLASVAATANEADQNLADLINQNVAQFELELQGVIEQDLVSPVANMPMGSMELPATSGGYLDSTPVGVQEVVITEVHSLAQAGELSNPAAMRDLGLASQAYAASNYKLAFQYYRLAYQAAAG